MCVFFICFPIQPMFINIRQGRDDRWSFMDLNFQLYFKLCEDQSWHSDYDDAFSSAFWSAINEEVELRITISIAADSYAVVLGMAAFNPRPHMPDTGHGHRGCLGRVMLWRSFDSSRRWDEGIFGTLNLGFCIHSFNLIRLSVGDYSQITVFYKIIAYQRLDERYYGAGPTHHVYRLRSNLKRNTCIVASLRFCGCFSESPIQQRETCCRGAAAGQH